jgi:deoxyribonuclease-4
MVRFGPSGNDEKFYAEGNKSSIQAPAWLAGMGLTAYEVNFGRGIKMGDKMAQELGEQARAHNISISFHAPYYINLASPDPDAIKKSYSYIEKCLQVAKTVSGGIASLPLASRVVIHVGSQCDLARDVAVENCKKNLKWVVDKLRTDGFSNFLLQGNWDLPRNLRNL